MSDEPIRRVEMIEEVSAHGERRFEMLKVWPQRGLKVISVTNVLFHNVQPGKLIVLFDHTKDKRWQARVETVAGDTPNADAR